VKLTIFAATGGVGRQLLDQALAAGHDVTAVVRNPAKLGREVRTVTADLAAPDPAALRAAVDGAAGVLSALGPPARSETAVAAHGTRAIVEAMLATGTRRLVAISAAPVSTVPSPGRPHPPRRDPGEGFLMRHLGTPLAQRVFRRNYADLALMEDLLRGCPLDWTAARPPRLTDKPFTGTYRTALGRNLKRGSQLSRPDLAHFMLRTLDDPATFRQAVGVAR
jgi:putative NADH-flavin reductase